MADDEEDNVPMPPKQTRALDTTTASADVFTLNNLVVSMRPLVKKARVSTVHKLTRQITKLRSKKGTEAQLEANKKKADRLAEEVLMLKKLKEDQVSKYALGNTLTLGDSTVQANISLKGMTRLSGHEVIQARVKAFRQDHSDWKALAAFIQSKNTGRRFKKKKPKDTEEKKKSKSQEEKTGKVKKKGKNSQETLKDGKNRAVKKTKDTKDDNRTLDDRDNNDIEEEDKTIPETKVIISTVSEEQSDVAESDNEASTSDAAESESEDETQTNVIKTQGSNLIAEAVAKASSSSDAESPHSDSSSSDYSDSEKELDSVMSTSILKGEPMKSLKKNKKESISRTKNPKELLEFSKSEHLKKLDEHSSLDIQNPRSTEMVVTKLSLDNTESEGKDDIAFLFGSKTATAGDSNNETVSMKKKKKKDIFFLAGDSEDDSDGPADDGVGEAWVEEDSEGDDLSAESAARKFRQEMRSTFVGTLGEKPQKRPFERRTRGEMDYSGKRPRWQEKNERRPFTSNKPVRGKTFAQGGAGRGSRVQVKPGQIGEKPAVEEKLHPSWEASKRKKEQQSKILTFTGKKTTFGDDSD